MKMILSVLCVFASALNAGLPSFYNNAAPSECFDNFVCDQCPVLTEDITGQIPRINSFTSKGYLKFPNHAQYKNADWDHVVGMANVSSLSEAFEIANTDEEIDYFFYTKSESMVLETSEGTYRHFIEGDAVFFSGTPHWGTAPGMADGYMKTYE